LCFLIFFFKKSYQYKDKNISLFTGRMSTRSVVSAVTNLCLTSKDGDMFNVSVVIMNINQLVREMTEESEGDLVIPLPNVSSKELKKVIEFCEYFHTNPMKNIDKPLKSTNFEECVTKWYSDFMNMPKEDVFNMVMAANYLDNKPLLELSCAKVATLIKGRTPEEIRNVFEIENDFSQEEEVRIREDNKWCNDVAN